MSEYLFLTDEEQNEFDRRMVRAAWEHISGLDAASHISAADETRILVKGYNAACKEEDRIDAELAARPKEDGKRGPFFSGDAVQSVATCLACVVYGDTVYDRISIDNFAPRNYISNRFLVFGTFMSLLKNIHAIKLIEEEINDDDFSCRANGEDLQHAIKGLNEPEKPKTNSDGE